MNTKLKSKLYSLYCTYGPYDTAIKCIRGQRFGSFIMKHTVEPIQNRDC